MISPKFHITLKTQYHCRAILSVLHDISRKQPPAHLFVVLRYETASLDIWFPMFREKVVVLPSREGISERNVRLLEVAEDQYLADSAGKTETHLDF